MFKHIRQALLATIVLTLILGLAYPLAMTYLSGALFPHQAHGSLVKKEDGTIIGSELIGQNFAGATYFHGRPSATTDTDPNDATKTVPAPYNAASSNASNAAPSSKALIADVQSRVEALKAENPDAKGEVPVDLVTTSGSGLDPDISVAAALYQVPRVAKARGMKDDDVIRLVQANTEGRTFGLLGEPRVNVLKLNLALDAVKK
ncbi:MAG TPA: potassium-transporting ATPase subunit KdpC [Magnetospirillaceae bacterium]|nr:potassium-transporting ATPase subunit KdpC [Magnetospirillaceae bacterium]